MQIVALEQDGEIVALEPQEFTVEVDLQDLLRDYPRLLLAPVPDYQDRQIWTIGYEVGSRAGSIDLLCLDSTGEVWVVETKLAKNPEAKKQVVGQVLAYASVVATWTEDRLEAVAQDYLGEPLVEYLADQLGVEETEDLIGKAVEKLRQGDITALVVLDELNPVLQRVVEFVNAHSVFELLALTVSLTEHNGTRFVIPAVTGASGSKAVSSTGRSDESLEELMEAASEEFLEVFDRLHDWAERHGYVWSTTPKGHLLESAQGEFILRLFPRWDSIVLSLNSIIRAEMDGEADHLRDRLASLIGSRPEKDPNVYANQVVGSWEEFVSTLDEYVATRTSANEVLRAYE